MSTERAQRERERADMVQRLFEMEGQIASLDGIIERVAPSVAARRDDGADTQQLRLNLVALRALRQERAEERMHLLHDLMRHDRDDARP